MTVIDQLSRPARDVHAADPARPRHNRDPSRGRNGLDLSFKGNGQSSDNRSPSAGLLTAADHEKQVEGIRSAWEQAGNGGGDNAPLADGQKSFDRLPVIAESVNPFRLPAPSIASAAASPTIPTEKVDQIVDILVNRLETVTVGRLPGGNFHLLLDRASFGVSGVSLSISPGTVAVVLEGNFRSEALAPAAQTLVRRLQTHFPNRNIRVLAKSDSESAEQTEAAPENAAGPATRVTMTQSGEYRGS